MKNIEMDPHIYTYIYKLFDKRQKDHSVNYLNIWINDCTVICIKQIFLYRF